jgi:hypothetical protein
LRGPVCTAGGGTTITVTVCGSALSLLPGFNVRACEQAQGAQERFTTNVSGFSNSEQSSMVNPSSDGG